MNLWRYMDLPKFKRFVEQGALYFCGARHFEDPFEGEYAWGKIGHKRYLESQKELAKRHGGGMSERDFMTINLKTLRELADHAYINCWYKSPHESEAMWKLYCENSSEGVLVGTTLAKLKVQLERKGLPGLEMKEVRYLPNFWVKEYNPESSVFFSKRVSFEHEKEFRAVFRNNPYNSGPPMKGKLVQVDLKEMIDTVRVSPFALPGLQKNVEEILRGAGLSCQVESSEIEMHPIMSVHEEVLEIGEGWVKSLVSLKTRS
ncbi:hypothetical protein [Pseudomonas nitroreducens]|uniref:hypothetical protein n=1 Tax=Pseudomonas nitroreducens TaxID=46680 RepID=UPI00351D23F9